MDTYIQKLEKYGQEHILEIMKNFSDDEKKALANQIEQLDIENVENLYNEINKNEINLGNINIEPISALKKNKLSESQLKEIDNIGKNIICSNQFAVATMSGG